MRSSIHASLLSMLLVLVLRPTPGQHPFGDPMPAPSGPPPGMGSKIGEMNVIKDPEGLKEFISGDVVSLIMFTEGEEDTNESNWFMLFNISASAGLDPVTCGFTTLLSYLSFVC